MTVASPIRPRTAELSLLEHSLKEICKEFPLFDTRKFLDRVRNQGAAHSMEACGSASLWACLNAAIALSAHAKIANSSFGELSPFVWAYFKDVYATFPELFLHGNDVDTVRALVLIALFGRNSADARTTLLLLSTALRLSQTLDLRSCTAVELEDARRASWAAFVLDAELSLCYGVAPALGAGNIELDLPSHENLDGGHEACAGFRWRAELALIHSAVRARLYSREAFNMPKSELIGTIVTLDQTLEDWRRKISLVEQPGFIRGSLELHSVILHLAFHNLTSMVHLAARRHSAWHVATQGRPEERSLSVITLSRLKVQAAAQHTLRLLRQSPFEQFAQFWYECSLDIEGPN